MDKAPLEVTIQTARQFLEQTLGFGEPVTGASLATLFSEKEESLYYGVNKGNSHASLNAVTRTQWDNSHMTESGRVYADIFSHPINRVKEFIEQEFATRGLIPSDILNPSQGNRIHQLLRLLRAFQAAYLEHIDPMADLQTSLTLRPVDKTNNFDLLLRVGLFTKKENMYFETTFSNIVQGCFNLLTERQISAATEAVDAYLQCFNKSSKKFRAITGFELSKFITHNVINENKCNAEIVYANYYQFLQANKGYLKERVDIIQAEEVVEWQTLSLADRYIVSYAFDIARTHITGFISFNMMEAQSVS
jgi:hypothetical protein